MVDGGFVGHQQVEQASAHTTVYGPVPASKDKAVDPHQPKPKDSLAVAAWRARMGTDEAKAIYKNRAATAECVNAHSRNRGLQQFRVRGLAKVKCVVLFFALAHNLMRMASLAPEMLALGKVAPRPARVRAAMNSRASSNSGACASYSARASGFARMRAFRAASSVIGQVLIISGARSTAGMPAARAFHKS